MNTGKFGKGELCRFYCQIVSFSDEGYLASDCLKTLARIQQIFKFPRSCGLN